MDSEHQTVSRKSFSFSHSPDCCSDWDYVLLLTYAFPFLSLEHYAHSTSSLIWGINDSVYQKSDLTKKIISKILFFFFFQNCIVYQKTTHYFSICSTFNLIMRTWLHKSHATFYSYCSLSQGSGTNCQTSTALTIKIIDTWSKKPTAPSSPCNKIFPNTMLFWESHRTRDWIILLCIQAYTKRYVHTYLI